MDFFAQISSLLRRGEFSQPILNFINGEFVPPEDGNFADTLNPNTGGLACEYPLSTTLDLEKAVGAACNASRLWSRKSKIVRADILYHVADLLEKRAEDFIRAEILDQGRAIHGVSKDDNDIIREVHTVKHLTAQAVAAMEPATQSHNCISYASRDPVGVVGIITPWASPLHSILWHMAPALACGNCVVIKPSSLAPLEVHLLAKTLSDAGVPKGVVNVVYGKGDVVGKALATHPNVKALALVGSERTASAMLRESHLLCTKRFTFTLGNCHPVIVFEDANLDEVLPIALKGSFLHNEGQNVHCVDRIFVHTSILEEFKERFVRVVKRLKVGSPHDSTIQVGPLISKEHRQKMLGFIQGAVNDGAEILCGGKIPKIDSKLDKGFFLEPTVLGGFNNATDNKINTLQVQGPVVRIIPFRTAEEAIEGANGTMYGLSASVWSKDISRAHTTASQLNAGSVWINDWLPNVPSMPHEGWNHSGLGRTGGGYSIDFYTKMKTVSIKL